MLMTLLVALIALAFGCAQAPDSRIQAVYDEETGRLGHLAYDSNGNGVPDSWSYMDGARLLRAELDQDEDGRIDRWEYYGPDRQLEKVGLSRANDGAVDSWVYEGADGAIARIEISTARDGLVNRTEYYEGDAIVRAEEDTNRNGAIDKWETFAGGILTSVAFDTEGAGTPTRRLVYGPDGSLDRLENLSATSPAH
jgi:hypothetical protein